MTNTVRNAGWFIIVAVVTLVVSMPMMASGLPSEGPEICGGAVTAGVLGLGWWAATSLHGQKGKQ